MRKAKKKEKLNRIEHQLNKSTVGVSNKWVLDILDLNYFRLLYLADYGRLGKTKSILYAFKLGFLKGKSMYKPDEKERKTQDIVFDAVVKLQKAKTALQTTIECYGMNRQNFTKDEIFAVGCSASNICDMLFIADDYVDDVCKVLERGILDGQCGSEV